MNITKINFCGSIVDVSGYGEFARYFIYALHNAGVDVEVEPILIEPQNLDFGRKGQLCKQLSKKNINAKINIINMIPTMFRRYKKPGAKNIGFTMWEASKIPPIWTKMCNEMDAIFVPCSWNKTVFADSGVKVPIYVVPPGIEEDKVPELKPKDYFGTYRFYSIFQWLERKNPNGLVKAYLSEFSAKDDVSLVLKTYYRVKNANNEALLKKEIESIRNSMNIKEKDAAKIELIAGQLSDQQMSGLHSNNHCFVLPTRAEGWGLGNFESMFNGNPTIGTGYSSVTDFMLPDNSYLLNYTLTPSVNTGSMMHNWYSGKMWWAEADLGHLASTMRSIFKDPQKAAAMGVKGRKHILDNFTMAQTANKFMSAVGKVVDG